MWPFGTKAGNEADPQDLTDAREALRDKFGAREKDPQTGKPKPLKTGDLTIRDIYHLLIIIEHNTETERRGSKRKTPSIPPITAPHDNTIITTKGNHTSNMWRSLLDNPDDSRWHEQIDFEKSQSMRWIPIKLRKNTITVQFTDDAPQEWRLQVSEGSSNYDIESIQTVLTDVGFPQK